MIDTIKKWLSVFDLPSGVVLGIHTLVMIALSIASFILKRPIEASIQTVYAVVLGAFAIHKTTTAVTTITSNATQGPDDAPKQ